jgi:protein phosphatase/serine/threonine-protein phosphatase Stp1
MSADRFLSWATTHVGTVRSHNEDALVNRPDLGLWAVADGAGGHSRGDVASRMIVEALEAIPPDLTAGEMLMEVRQRLTEAHETLRGSGDDENHVISASTVVVLIARGDHFACLWAGDSRAYLVRDGEMTQITRDHSLVQELVDAGAITAAEAETHPSANVITRAVGSDGDLDLDKVTSAMLPGDRFLLCSDGLCKTVPEAEIAALMATPAPGGPTEPLITATLAHRGRDNVTAVAIEVLAGSDPGFG